jgi:hypothetical protein
MTAPDMRLLHGVREPPCDGRRQITRLAKDDAPATAVHRSSPQFNDVPALSQYCQTIQ